MVNILRALGVSRKLARPTLCWDFHCHLIPGVDDGVRTLDEAREAIEGLRALGYRGSVVTPHIYAGVYDNKSTSLRAAFDDLRKEVGSNYELRLAAEYHATDAFFDLIAQNDLLFLPVGGERLVLVEFPYLMPPPRGMNAVAALAQAGYRPVIAHVERYRYFQTDPELWLSRLSRNDGWTQCNIGSLSGMYGQGPRRFAQDLLKRGLPVIWGTDLHRPRQIGRYISSGLDNLRGLGKLNSILDAMEDDA